MERQWSNKRKICCWCTLTQLKFVHYIFLNFCFVIRNADSDKINGKYVVGDPLTQFKLIK